MNAITYKLAYTVAMPVTERLPRSIRRALQPYFAAKADHHANTRTNHHDGYDVDAYDVWADLDCVASR